VYSSPTGFQYPILTQHGNSARLCLLTNKEVSANLRCLQAAAGLKSQVHGDLEPEIGERRVGGKR
jgi:hypothetical protein